MTTSRRLTWAALVLAMLVALREVIYYFDHPHRSGPALVIATLGFAVGFLALALLRRPD